MPVIPYVDNTTFIEAPTGIDPSQIVPQGTDPEEAAALTNLLRRATAWATRIMRQDLRATQENPETRAVRPDPYGRLKVFPRNFPIISVVSGTWWDTWSASPTNWDVSKILIEDRDFLVYDKDYTLWRGIGTPPLQLEYVYQAGFTHTQLSADVAAAATQITVDSILGIGTGLNQTMQLEFLDGGNREDITVDHLVGNVLHLTAGLVNAHTKGALVTALPEDVQQATITLCAFLIRSRGTGALVMGARGISAGRGSQQGVQGAQRIAEQTGLSEATSMLLPWTRVL